MKDFELGSCGSWLLQSWTVNLRHRWENPNRAEPRPELAHHRPKPRSRGNAWGWRAAELLIRMVEVILDRLGGSRGRGHPDGRVFLDINPGDTIRYGLGQLLRYRHKMASRESDPVAAVPVLERAPTDLAWIELCAELEVVLTWPEAFEKDLQSLGAVLSEY